MDTLLRNNCVRIYTTNYINGSYAYSSTLIHDTYPQEQSSGSIGCHCCKGDTGPTGPTGYAGSSGYDVASSTAYEMRRLNVRVYKAYRVEFKPTHNTQESYDEIVCPFLDLDDIGVELQVYEPKVTQVRVDIKPEFLDEHVRLQDYNQKLAIFNNFVQSVFGQIKTTTVEGYENIKATATSDLNDDLVHHKEELDAIILRIIEDFTQYNSQQEDNGYDSDYDSYHAYPPSSYSYIKSPRYVPNDWYDYRYDVAFNDTTKLFIKCHEGTNMYDTVDAFINSLP